MFRFSRAFTGFNLKPIIPRLGSVFSLLLGFFDWYKYDGAMHFRAEFLDFLYDDLLASNLNELTNEL